MNKLCFNCSHGNDYKIHRCVECGSPFPKENPAALSGKSKQGISLNAKWITVVSIVLITSLAVLIVGAGPSEYGR